jgi:hypothetical protein
VMQAAKHDLATLEYLAIVHDIFHRVLLNKKIFLEEKTIDEIEIFVKYRMEILGEWNQSHLSRQPKEEHKRKDSLPRDAPSDIE